MRIAGRRFAVVLAVGVVVAACADDSVDQPVGDLFEDDPSSSSTPADPTDADATSSSVTSSTVPVAERLPPLADDARGAVRTDEGAVLAITGTDGENWLVVDTCGAPGSVPAASATVVGPHHVVLDPGNGGDDRGVVGPGGLEEAEVNLDVARRAAEILRGHGMAVLSTRDGDVAMTGPARAAIAEAVAARVFVSIQHREGPGQPSPIPGTESFHRIDDPDSRRLAGLVFEELQDGLGQLGAEWRAPDEPGVKPLLNQRGEDFHTVLRATAGVPAAFVEALVLSGDAEAGLLGNEEGRQAEAELIAAAIVRFMVTDEQGRGFIEPAERVRTAEPAAAAAECP